MATRTLQIVLAGDSASARREFSRTEQAAGKMGKSLDREGKRVHGFAAFTSKGFGRVGLAATGMAAAGGGAVALLAKSFVTGATSINESLTKNEVLFGKHAASIDRFSQRTAKNLGISRQAALEATGTFGNLFVALEIGPKKSAGMSVALTKLAADLASFNNASPEEALEAIRSGLVGETEPLRRFGVNLNDAALRTQALKMGLIDTVKNALTPQQKALAVNALLFKQTEKAQGDFARTSGGLANQQRILKARFADAGAELGGKLMPFALKAVSALNSLFDSSSKGGRVIAAVGRAASTAGDFIRDKYGAATRAVTAWVDKNRSELETVIRAFRNLARAVQFVFEEVLLPVIRTVIRRVVPILDSLKDTISGLVRFVTNVLTGQWGKAWDAAKDTVSGALRTVKNVIVGFADVLFTAVKALGGVIIKGLVAGLKGLGSAIKNAVIAGVKAGIGAAKGAVGDVIGFLNPFGDGIGRLSKKIGDGVGNIFPQFGGGLMGARPELAPIAGMASRFGLGVSSGLRPGARTSSGNQSWHATGEAIDVSGPSSGMMGFARFMSKRAGSLAELIYTPLGAWSNGSRYTPTGKLAADHYDHVHVAMDVGAPGQGDGPGRGRPRGDRDPWFQTVEDAARKAAIAPKILYGVWGAESNFSHGPGPSSPAGAQGPFQFMPATARSMGVNPHNFKSAAYGAARYLAQYKSRGLRGMLAAYNAGPAGDPNNAETRAYIPRVLAFAARWDSGGRRGSGSGGGGGGGGGNTAIGGGGGHGSVTGSGSNTVSGIGSTSPGPLMGLGFEGKLARNQVRQARAEARDDLSGMIKALVAERALKRKRLKLINKVLGGRLSRERRTRLLQEKAQLIGEIGDLTDTIKEYKADRAGGATTITAADALEAGVAPDTGGGAGGGAAGPDPNVALLAQLTGEMVANQNRLIRLMETQGPQLLAGVVAAVNGGIGGKLGLGGLQAAGIPGQLARY